MLGISITLLFIMHYMGVMSSDLFPILSTVTSVSHTPSGYPGQTTRSADSLGRPTLVPVPKQLSLGIKVVGSGTLSGGAEFGLTEEEHIHFAHPSNRKYISQLIQTLYFADIHNDQNKIATLKLFAEKNSVKIISVDRFPHILDNATCADGSVSLKFNNEESLHQAVNQWHWVNTDENHKIVLFTFSYHCDLGVDRKDDLQLWDVDSFSHNSSAKSITFSAKPKEAHELFKSWHLVANSRGLDPVPLEHRRLRRDISKSTSIDITSDFSKTGNRNLGFCWPDTVSAKGILLPNDSPEQAAGCMYCEICSTFGSFDFEIDISMDITDIGGTFKLTTNNVGATLLARTELYKSQLRGVPFEQEIFGFVPPGAGTYIRNLIDIGPTLKISLSATIGDIPEPLSLSTGLNVTIPDDSQITIDISGSAKSGISGWTPKVELLGPNLSNGASLTATVGPDIELFLAAQVAGQGVTAGFSWAPGELDVKAKSVDEAPACGIPKAKKGVEYEVDIGTSLNAFATFKVFGKGTNKTWPLASAEEETASTCQPISDSTQISRPTAMPSTLLDEFVPKNDLIGKIEGAISTGIASASAVVDAISSAVVPVASEVVGAVETAAKDVAGAIASGVNTIEDGVEDVGHKVEDVFHGIFG